MQKDLLNDNSTIGIANITTKRVSLPLTKPYLLSFASLTEFISIQLTIKFSDAKETTTEVVPLFGYSNENETSITSYLRKISPLLIGKNLKEARKIIEPSISGFPFATSPLLTAIDLYAFELLNDQKNIDFIHPISVQEFSINEFYSEIKPYFNYKLKLSGDGLKDLEVVRKLLCLEHNDISTIQISIDANQAYNFNQAYDLIKFIEANDKKNLIPYVEQPLPANQWKESIKLNNYFPDCPVALDESITTLDDLNYAINHGIKFIKLKLFKQGGIKELILLAKIAHKNGVNVIIGNGVATGLSNRIENTIYNLYSSLFYGPSEANGFKKLKDGS